MKNKDLRFVLMILLVFSLCACGISERQTETNEAAAGESQQAQSISESEPTAESLPKQEEDSGNDVGSAEPDRKAIGYETSFTKMDFLKEVSAVYQMAHDNGYVYGDSHGTPPCSDGFISCDRLVARALWNLGLTDQPEGGFIVEQEEDYLMQHGFEKIEKQEELRGGDIVIQRNEEGHLIHSFVLVFYDPITTECIKYDCGHFTPEGADRISSQQPFYTVLADFPERKFYCGFRIKERYEAVSEEGSDELAEELESSDVVEMRLNEMSTEAKVAQLFFLTPDQMTGVSGTKSAGEVLREKYNQYPVGGIVLFEENIESPEQISSFTQEMKRIGQSRIGLDPFLAVDEEGGDVLRLGDVGSFGLPWVPSMSEIGASGNAARAADTGRTIGTYLNSYGFNVDFAPVADVTINGGGLNTSRFFSSDPQIVADMVSSEVTALQDTGVSATLKHFPGHGAASGDSHNGAAVVNRTLDELRSCEFVSFKAGIEAGTDFIMMGHLALPNVTGTDVPSTLSSMVITDILRKELGYDGIVITDSMRMHAITDYYNSGEAAVAAFLAGNDMILMPADFDAAYTGVLGAVYDGRISTERLNESVRRILKVKLR